MCCLTDLYHSNSNILYLQEKNRKSNFIKTGVYEGSIQITFFIHSYSIDLARLWLHYYSDHYIHTMQLLEFSLLELSWSVLIELERDWAKVRLRVYICAAQSVSVSLSLNSSVWLSHTDSHNHIILVVVLYAETMHLILSLQPASMVHPIIYHTYCGLFWE